MQKRSRLSLLTGVIYVIGAIFGLLISSGGLYVLWSTRPTVTRELTETAGLFGRFLGATGRTIQVVNGSLDQASHDLELSHAMLLDVAQTLDDSQGLIDATAGLIGSDLAGFFEETQTSLEAVEASAQTVDQALAVVESIRDALAGLRALIPFTPPPGESLPRASLQQSVAEVRRSLAPVPDSLGEIERQLSVSAANVATMQSELEQLAGQVAGIETSLDEARAVTAEYRAILDDLQERLERFEGRLPLLLRLVYLGLTLILAWIFMTQAGMLVHGIALLRGRG
jgi:hypothetical protein